MATWIFQGNPDDYEIDAYLAASRGSIQWRTTRYSNQISPGDTVYLWRSKGSEGLEPGVLAAGTVTERPRVQRDDHWARSYWRKPVANEPMMQVRIQIDRKAPKGRLLLRDEIKQDKLLSKLLILRRPAGTNFPVTSTEARRLALLWAGTRTNGTQAASRPTHYLFKLNAADCPNGIGIPRVAADWMRGEFRLRGVPKALQLLQGDRVFVWTNETRDGAGLVAQGQVREFNRSGGICRLHHLSIVSKSEINNAQAELRKGRDNVLKQIRTSAVKAVRPLNPQEWHELESIVMQPARKPSSSPGHVARRDQLFDEVLDDIEAIYDRKPGPTERDRLVSTRLGQGQFRSEVMSRWGRACALTGSKQSELLRASHIKAWRACRSDSERLDPSNGLLLDASLDALFDKHLISFRPDGTLLISARVSFIERQRLQLNKLKLRRVLKAQERNYLRHHRRAFHSLSIGQ